MFVFVFVCVWVGAGEVDKGAETEVAYKQRRSRINMANVASCLRVSIGFLRLRKKKKEEISFDAPRQ
jgi:hypothetical protein